MPRSDSIEIRASWGRKPFTVRASSFGYGCSRPLRSFLISLLLLPLPPPECPDFGSVIIGSLPVFLLLVACIDCGFTTVTVVVLIFVEAACAKSATFVVEIVIKKRAAPT